MPTEEQVRECLRGVYDPDVPANIVDLGLVYAIHADEDSVSVRMTLTRPGSPLSESISEEIRDIIHSRLPETDDVQVEIVWEPPWYPDLMSEDARAHLGM